MTMKRREIKIFKPFLVTLLLCGLSYDVLAVENTTTDMIEEVAESTPKTGKYRRITKSSPKPGSQHDLSSFSEQQELQ